MFARVYVAFALLFLGGALIWAAPSASPLPPKKFAAIAQAAEQARAAERLTDALRLYAKGVSLRPSWSEGWWFLGTLLYDQDRFPEARAAFTRFVALTPESGPGLALLGLCEYETHAWDQARAHLEQWAGKKNAGSKDLRAVAGFHRALLLTRAGRFEQSLALLTLRQKAGGAGPALVEAMGLACLRLSQTPEEYPAEQREAVWLAGSAESAAVGRDFGLAEIRARKLLLHYAQRPNVHYFIGTILLQANQEQAADAEFESELAISPGHVPALVQMAGRHLQRGEPGLALPIAERAIAAAPEDAPAHTIRGRALLDLGRFEESARELELARHLVPGSTSVRWTLSRAYTALGRTRDAEQERAASASLADRERKRGPE